MRAIRSASGVRRVAALALATAALGTSGTASAYPEFPGYLQNIFPGIGKDCAPSCLLCHTDPLGGKEHMKGTGAAPLGLPGRGKGVFLQNLLDHQDATHIISGLMETPTQDALAGVIERLRTLGCNNPDDPADTVVCDSDGDRKSDVDELAAALDPDNSRPDAPLCIGPRYGCGAHVAPTPAPLRSGQPAAVLAALGVAVLLFRRRRS